MEFSQKGVDKVDGDEFRVKLISLRRNQTVVFEFKGMVHWATNFLALFNVPPLMFQIAPESAISWEVVNRFMMWRDTYDHGFPVTCRVLNPINKACLSLDWVVDYIGPLLDDFIVVTKPE
ncbi:hypothetical protein GYA27_04530 [candidate division WWE3 bacterium]|uniref:Uncharacterized protein n=1 Tax=candidate division WWE3 bacterium TaxID=2053526 RepID=A0A7X9DL17_UNCKA|nr:hypothetical protein [candidate division WWE3 bacterium]